MKRRKVLVCGSNYGASYLAALRKNPERYKPAGLLARGSMDSMRLAIENAIPLFCSLEELPPGIDLACVALPTHASDVAIGLLERRIPVLCEHPRKEDFLTQALRTADAAGTVFHLNTHFGDLNAGLVFTRAAQLECRESKPVLIEVVATERSVYAALDLIARSVGMPGNTWHGTGSGAWATVEGVTEGISTLMRVQTGPIGMDAAVEDGSSEYLVDIRITCVFPHGLLTMLSVAGPVVWSANLNLALGKGLALWRALPGGGIHSGEKLQLDRQNANLRALRALERQAFGGHAVPWQQAEHLLGVSRSWEALTAALGF